MWSFLHGKKSFPHSSHFFSVDPQYAHFPCAVNQAQAQQQMQLQRQEFILNALLNGFGQIAKATNSSIIVGSAGASSGHQHANPTNVVA